MLDYFLLVVPVSRWHRYYQPLKHNSDVQPWHAMLGDQPPSIVQEHREENRGIGARAGRRCVVGAAGQRVNRHVADGWPSQQHEGGDLVPTQRPDLAGVEIFDQAGPHSVRSRRREIGRHPATGSRTSEVPPKLGT
jgi:hypothetical protein